MKQAVTLDRPIVVLGAARSGTTLLADGLLSTHPEVAYWGEPNYVWRHGHAYRRDDVLEARDATPSIRRYIRGRFREYADRAGRSRFMEKTPSNCLRVPFVLEVLPEAKIVHLLRDGRDVAYSAAQEWSGMGIPRDPPGTPKTRRGAPMAWRIVRNETRISNRVRDLRGLIELPAYVPRLVDIFRRQVFHRSEIPWGPRIPGLHRLRARFSLLQTCALQWEACARMARSALHGLPPERCMEVRYEDLVARPHEVLGAILAFLELELDSGAFEAMASRVKPPRQTWRESLAPEDRRAIEAVVGSTLLDLGYPVLTTDSGRRDEGPSGPPRE